MYKFLFAMVLALGATCAHADRIRDLTSVQGVRENSLIGYGLVVGLDGTGDQTTQTPFTTQSLNNMLSQLGITVPTGTNMQLKNVAAVMVTASFPAFARQGQTIDVVVSSMGNAKSLRGGTLLMTYFSGVVDDSGLAYLGGTPHDLTDVLGVRATELDALYPQDVQHMVFPDGRRYAVHELCELPEKHDAQVLAEYGEDFYAGLPCLTKHAFGAGQALSLIHI